MEKAQASRLLTALLVAGSLFLIGSPASADHGDVDWHTHYVSGSSCAVNVRGGDGSIGFECPEASTKAVTSGCGLIGARLQYRNTLLGTNEYTSWVWVHSDGFNGAHALALEAARARRAVRSYHYADDRYVGAQLYLYHVHYVEDWHV